MGKKAKLLYQYLLLTIKTILFFWILFPVLFIYFVISKIKSMLFLRKEKILAYMERHIDEIEGLRGPRIYNLKIDKIRKGVSNLVWKQSFSTDNGRRITLVGKKFLPFGSFISFISAYLGPLPKGIPMSIDRRFKQEIDSLSVLKRDSVYAPKVVFSDNRERLFLMEYIPGIDAGDFLEQIEVARETNAQFTDFFHGCGKSLALLHRFGLSLVSHNDRSRIAENSNGRIYFVDFEQSTRNDYRAWDLAIFAHWIRVKLGNSDGRKTEKIETAFFKGYKTLEPVNYKAVNRHLDDLRVYMPFAKIATWINRRQKQKAIRT